MNPPAAPRPRMPDVGILGLVPDAWSPPWMPRHQVLKRLASYFHVVWVTPPLEWRSMWLHGERLADTDPGIPGLTIYRPGRWVPRVYRPAAAARFTEWLRLRQARALLGRQGVERVCLYLWRPDFAPAMELVDHDASCYHIDDEYTFSTVEQGIPTGEADLIRASDQVIIHSPALLAKKGDLNPRTLFIPNGVDYSAYAEEREEPADLAAVPHPRIGYVGVIKSQLDLPLLEELAHRHPSWSFVMVGPEGTLYGHAPVLERLKELENVHFLGPKPLADLPAYNQHMDTAMLIYEVNDYTKYIYPLKLHECLATGRPVVASPIRTLREFPEVVTLAEGLEGWSHALSRALSPEAMEPGRVRARRAVAREHDWAHLTRRIARSFCELLGPAYVERFDALAAEGAAR